MLLELSEAARERLALGVGERRRPRARDRIDAPGAIEGKSNALTNDDLARLWLELCGNNAQKSYAALWRLKASPAEAIPFLHDKLAIKGSGPDGAQLRKWIAELDAELLLELSDQHELRY